ncbi:MAG: DUF3179 domain-containing (seleno)protein [Candidatus Roizmanbacteria bacterium]
MLKKISLTLIFFLLIFGGLFFFVKKNKSIIRSFDQMWGDPAKEMFPEINNPSYVPVNKAQEFLNDKEEVYFVRFGKKIFVYPANILSFHHIVNDVIEKKPVAITLCLLSDSAIVYSRNVDGKDLSLAVLGPLYYGNLVIYDKETDSYWLQLTGEAFKGTLKGKKLMMAADIEKTTWDKVKNLNNLFVLPPVKPVDFYRSFYAKFKDNQMGLQSLIKKKAVDTRLPAYEKGIGVIIGDKAIFYPLNKIKNETIIKKNSSTYTSVFWFAWSAFFPETKIVY